MSTVLLCDDEPAVLFTIEEALGELRTAAGVGTVACRSAAEALAQLESADVLVTDLVMPDMDGLALLAEARRREPELPVILLTARGSERVAVAAMKQGAYDYLTKPFGIDELRAVVARALEARTLRRSVQRLELERALGKPMAGVSAAWRRLMSDAERVARRDVTVLVRGETGTGKELVATLLHAASARRERACVRFNCAAIPAELAEAELFGHARGAFTGAAAARPGFFKQADGGTLILDEVGELPLAVQSKLLRVLQEGEIQPVGAGKVERVDVRVVACTHRDLAADAKGGRGRFREDLYYRLAVVELSVPPLRQRREDIAPLVEVFVRRYAARFGLEGVRLSDALLAELTAREWPGNARELENTVARLMALSEGGDLDVGDLRRAEGATSATVAPAREGGREDVREDARGHLGLRARVAAFEREILERALSETGGNQSEAARRLGLTRMTLIDKLKRHGLLPAPGSR
jgi:two-component system response regulator AtoC